MFYLRGDNQRLGFGGQLDQAGIHLISGATGAVGGDREARSATEGFDHLDHGLLTAAGGGPAHGSDPIHRHHGCGNGAIFTRTGEAGELAGARHPLEELGCNERAIMPKGENVGFGIKVDRRGRMDAKP